jgi:isoquinoline 1-oxidoreductase beta subunit
VRRRQFLVGALTGGTALMVGFRIGRARANPAPAASKRARFQPNAFVSVDEAGLVTVTLPKSEMGQGVNTALTQLVAEELDVDLAAIQVETADADPRYVYAGAQMKFMLTGGSSSTRTSWLPLREAGAAARALLVAAAAAAWKCAPSEIHTESGKLLGPHGKQASYGEFVRAASDMQGKQPGEIKLKEPAQWKRIGKPLARVDVPAKVDGSAKFGLDLQLPGLLTAVVERCPAFGGRVAKLDASKAKAVKGVRHVVEIASGVAVVADGYWPAMQGRKALEVSWDFGPNANLSTSGLEKTFDEALAKTGAVARHQGDADGALASAKKKVEATYRLPYLAHSPLEPLNATAKIDAAGCHVWAPTQAQTFSQQVAAKITGLPLEKIFVHTTLLGGGFGRRGETDFVAEAVELAKATKSPVKVVWSREDEIQHGFYRPMMTTRISAALDASGMPIAWRQRIASPSIFQRVLPQFIQNGLDRTSVDGSGADMPYGIPNVHVDCVQMDVGVPVGFWRSVGHSSNGFATECFVDELAAAAGMDPVAYRRKLLADKPRERALLDLCAEKAGWSKPLAKGRTRGVALHGSFGSLVAQIAEISVENKAIKVHRVVCAVDCGPVVNPDILEAQIQGGIAFGLGPTLKSLITLEKGRVTQSNFHDYEVLRMAEMPHVEVHIVPSTEKLGGIGEVGVPPVAPAVANAVFAATKKRLRRLPLSSAWS